MSLPLRLMSTLAVEKAFKSSLLPAWRESGAAIEVEWNPTTVLMQRIKGGDRADAVVLIDAPMQELAASGIVLAESVVPIATAGLGLGVRSGSAVPDISTPEKFKQALLNARSIVVSRAGASGIYFSELVKRLGVKDEIDSKVIVIPAGFTGEKVVAGEAELAVQQISELMSVDGIEVVGPFPPPLQATTDFSVAIFADADQPEFARTFLKHLTSASAHEAYIKGGLTPRFAAPVIR